MRLPPTTLAMALVLSFAVETSRAGNADESAAERTSDVPPGTLLYLDQARWQQADRTQKIALATDFMRIFCGDPAMPPSVLVTCLDEARDSGSMFERALSCVATRPPRPKASP
jgi:hypothetical protein